MIRQVGAAARAHLAPNAGLVPLLLITAGWLGAPVILKFSSYTLDSLQYVATAAVCMGIGLRLHFSSNRAYLVPGLREANGIVALGFLAALIAIVSFAGPLGLPLPLFVAGLWFCSIALVYWVGLSRNPVRVLVIIVVFLVLFPLTGPVRSYLRHEISVASLQATAFLLTVNGILTVLLWRRICNVRGKQEIEPGGTSLRGLLDASSSFDSIPCNTLHGLWEQLRHFRYTTRTGVRDFYLLVSVFSVSALLLRFGLPWSGGDAFTAAAFGFPFAFPIALVAFPLRVSQTMFMLPLSRAEILKRWGAALFLSVLKYWSAFVLPFSLVTLFAGTGGGTQISLPTLLIATVAAQLPLFGIASMLLSFKMTAGLRYNIVTVLLLVIPALLPITGNFIQTDQTVWASILLGPVLIWLSYRRWRNVEV